MLSICYMHTYNVNGDIACQRCLILVSVFFFSQWPRKDRWPNVTVTWTKFFKQMFPLVCGSWLVEVHRKLFAQARWDKMCLGHLCFTLATTYFHGFFLLLLLFYDPCRNYYICQSHIILEDLLLFVVRRGSGECLSTLGVMKKLFISSSHTRRPQVAR